MKRLTYSHTMKASYIGYITQAIVNNLAPLLFLTFQTEFAISLEQIGFLITLNFGVQMLVDFLAVRFVDRIGYRPCIVAAHICAAIGLIGMGTLPYLLSDAYTGLMTAVIVYAIGGGLIEVLISPIVEALPGDAKASAMSLLHSFYCWGHVGVVLLSTLFFTIAGTGRWSYLAMLWALIPLFNTFFFLFVPIRTLEEDEESMPVRKLLKTKLFWVFILLMICSGAAEQAMSQWASLFAESGLMVSKTLGDLLGPCMFAFLMGLSRLYYGKFGARLNLMRFITGSSILCIISYLLAVFLPVPVLSLLACGLCGLSVGIMWPGVFSLAAEKCPGGGTAMFAFFALAGDVGCSAGPGLVGIISGAADSGRLTFLNSLTVFMNGNTGLKTGLLCAIIFPLILLVTLQNLRKTKSA